MIGIRHFSSTLKRGRSNIDVRRPRLSGGERKTGKNQQSGDAFHDISPCMPLFQRPVCYGCIISAKQHPSA
ncbi:hypothetical protein AKG12_07445 [Agrobacterium sp. SUL3]|nr:hypothetical protein AKG12_07445 [Agrobacterium sp. SUL3]